MDERASDHSRALTPQKIQIRLNIRHVPACLAEAWRPTLGQGFRQGSTVELGSLRSAWSAQGLER